MRNKSLIGGILLAVVAIMYVAFLYPWPSTPQTEGTIGVAKKYHSDQISDKDVKLDGQNADQSTSAGVDGR